MQVGKDILNRTHTQNYKMKDWDFPGGPAGKTLCSQCRGLGSITAWGTRSRMHAATKRSRVPQLRPGTAKINK